MKLIERLKDKALEIYIIISIAIISFCIFLAIDKPKISHSELPSNESIDNLTTELKRLNDSIDQAKMAYAEYKMKSAKQLKESKKFTDRFENATDEEKINILKKKYPWMGGK